MISTVTLEGSSWSVDFERSVDISIPLLFNGPQPNAYGVARAKSEPCSTGELVGDTRRGGSCNFEQYTLIPHCNGTHTECVGHVTNERISVRDCLRDALVPAQVVTITPWPGTKSSDRYSSRFEESDLIICRKAIADATDLRGIKALIVRTMPNDKGKLSREYHETIPPYFSADAIDHIVQLGIEHLVVDLPSIDRLFDAGRLSNHRLFWNIPEGSFETNDGTRHYATITELAYVPNEVEDGTYLLNLQIAPFATDAAPSRPLLFPALKN